MSKLSSSTLMKKFLLFQETEKDVSHVKRTDTGPAAQNASANQVSDLLLSCRPQKCITSRRGARDGLDVFISMASDEHFGTGR